MAKTARRGTDNMLMMPASEPQRPVAGATLIGEGDIARRAFALFCDRGRQDGHDVEDWLAAERELQGAMSSSAA